MGQLDHSAQLPILLTQLENASEKAGRRVLRRWVRARGPLVATGVVAGDSP